MILSTDSYAEICKQSAFISALLAGFSFAFVGVLLVGWIRSKKLGIVSALIALISLIFFLLLMQTFTI